MPFDLWRPGALLGHGFYLERARKARRDALSDLPAGVSGSRNAPWNMPKIVMGLGLLVAVPGFFVSRLVGAVGAAIFVVGLLVTIVSAVVDTLRNR